MLQGFLTVLFVLLCFLMVLIILLQKSKGSLGILGSAGSGAQLLFGGSGGQDFFPKTYLDFYSIFYGWIVGFSSFKDARSFNIKI